MAHIGRYELVRRVGSGGMAEVWKARIQGPAGFEKFVAIKRILPHLAGDEFLEMFAQEAKLVVRLVHPNIVQVLDFGESGNESDDGPGYFIAMEYVAGQNLAQILKRLHRTQRKLPLEIGLYVIAEISKALSHAHAGVHQGGEYISVIHRDISPHNILVSFAGNVKVTDFGIAKVANAMNTQTSGLLKGKISYMSPEQAGLKSLDARSDIFCLGIILYELLVGERLFRGRTPEEVYAQIESFAELDAGDDRLAPLPGDVRQILLNTLRANPDERYQAALELEAALAGLLGPQGLIEARNSLSSLMLDLFQQEYQREMRGPGSNDQAEPTRPMIITPEDLDNSFPSLPGGTVPDSPDRRTTDISGRSNEDELRRAEPTNVTGEPTRTATKEAAEAAMAAEIDESATAADLDEIDRLASLIDASRGGSDPHRVPVEKTVAAEPHPGSGQIPVAPEVSSTARVGGPAAGVEVNERPATEATGPTGPSFESFQMGDTGSFEEDRPTHRSDREIEADRTTAEAILRDAVVPEGSAPKPTPSFQDQRRALVSVQKSQEAATATTSKRREDTTTVGVFPTAHRLGPPRWMIGAGVAGVLVLIAGGFLVSRIGRKGQAEPTPTPVAATAAAHPSVTPRVVTMTTTTLPTATPVPTAKPTATPVATVAVRSTPARTPRPTPTRRPVVRNTPVPVTWGSATILAKPWVQVSVDGKRIKGETPIRRHKLRSGSHTFTFVNPALKFRSTRKITVPKDREIKIFVDVEKKRVSVN